MKTHHPDLTDDIILLYVNLNSFFNYLLYVLFYFIFLKILFIYLFMAVLGLRFCERAFSSCGKWGPLFFAVRRPLTIAASLAAEHRLQTRRLSNCGSRAQSLRGMWDLPRPGLEPASPELAGRFSTPVPPGKPLNSFIEEMLQTYPKASPIQFFSFSPRYNNLFIHLFIQR